MMIGHDFPYLDTKDLNLDWLLKNMKKIITEWANYQAEMNQSFSELNEAFSALKSWVVTYFEELDVQQEINNKIDSMIESGELEEILQPIISSEVADWLADHITNPSSPPVDTSLSVSGAAADAKVTGNRIGALDNHVDDLLDATATSRKLDFTAYTGEMTSGVWRNPITYPAGYVESVRGKIADSSTQMVILVFTDPTTNIITHYFYYTGKSGEFTLPVDVTMKEPFGVGIYCLKLGLKAGTTPAYRTTYTSFAVGLDVTGVSVGNYDLAVDVVYKTIADRFADSVSENGGSYSIIADQNDFTNFTNAILSGYWFNDYAYEKGYIDYVTLKAPTSGAGTKCGIMIIDSTDDTVLFISENHVFGEDLLCDIPVHLYSLNPVYIACSNAAYASVNPSRQFIRYQGTKPMPGETLSYSWEGSATYKFGIKVTYSGVSPVDVAHCRTRRRMFICGDSITAGYPFNMGDTVIDGIRYGDAIGRALDFDVNFGAQSGNGWLYTSGSAYAYSITNDTDFSQYDVALYAWGTNDFYHDMALGDITDQYSDQTVCGTMNYCISKILTDNPGCVIIISTPLNRTYESGYGYTQANGEGYTLKQMVDKMIQLCEARGVMYIDNTCSPFNPNALAGLTGDGLHPSRIGYQVLGAYMTAKVGALVQPYASVSRGL